MWRTPSLAQQSAEAGSVGAERIRSSDEELLDLVLEGLDLALELGTLVGRDRRRDHRPRHTARTPQSLHPHEFPGSSQQRPMLRGNLRYALADHSRFSNFTDCPDIHSFAAPSYLL